MERLNLQDYLIGLNELLSSNGFKERFEFKKGTYKQGWRKIKYEELVLYNSDKKDKGIVFVSNRDDPTEGILYFLNTHIHLEFFDYNLQDNLATVFKLVEKVLSNKIIIYTMSESDMRGLYTMVDIFINPDYLHIEKMKKTFYRFQTNLKVGREISRKTLNFCYWISLYENARNNAKVGGVFGK